MKKTFDDMNGFLDTTNRYIGRWVWNDQQPYPVWNEKPIYQWTATELIGISSDNWGLIFDHVRPFPKQRTKEQRIADDLYWSKVDRCNARAKRLTAELPRIKVAH